MPINIIKNVVRWTGELNLSEEVRNDYLEKAKKYQRGETMLPVEEMQIVQILNEMDHSGDTGEYAALKEGAMADRIMIVDDDRQMRELIVCILEAEGYECISTFDNPRDALEQIQSGWIPEVLISDYGFSNSNGVVLIETARKAYPEIEGFIITANPGAVSDATSGLLILDKGDTGFVDRLIEAVKSCSRSVPPA